MPEIECILSSNFYFTALLRACQEIRFSRCAHWRTTKRKEPRKIITVTNQKGGVAKTTTAVSLAYGLAVATQQPPLLVDLDQQGQRAIALGMASEASRRAYHAGDKKAGSSLRHGQQDSMPFNRHVVVLSY